MRLFFQRSSIVVLLALFIPFPPAAHAVGPGGDVYFGYSRLGNDTFYPGVGGLNGWQLTGHLKFAPFTGVEADVSHYGLGAPSSTPRTTAVLFGPRVTVGAAGIHVFVHGLVGGEHSANNGNSPTPISGGALAVDFGGGADLRIAPFFALRVSADYINAPNNTPASGSHDRFGTGIVFRF